MEIQEGVILAPLTTFAIGGPATHFARVGSMQDLYDALAFAQTNRLKTFLLGGGSNILFADEGFEGLVLKIELAGIESVEEDNEVLLVAAAGESWEVLVAHAVEQQLWGIENLSGIPGTVGGAVVQNIGAYGAALSQTLEWVEVFDTQEERTRTFTNTQCAFAYRESIFKQEMGRYVVLHAAFRLVKTPTPNISYKDLAERFADTTPTLYDIRKAVIEIRKNKFPDLAVEGTAGSYFKNPIVPLAEAEKLQDMYPEMPVFSLPESGDIKIPLAWILDRVLNLRGYAHGSARLFEKQALVIAVQKPASSRDVRALAQDVSKKVFDACSISIEPEVYFVEK